MHRVKTICLGFNRDMHRCRHKASQSPILSVSNRRTTLEQNSGVYQGSGIGGNPMRELTTVSVENFRLLMAIDEFNVRGLRVYS